jgi:ligand-binding SRPBCC domain-containing protein
MRKVFSLRDEIPVNAPVERCFLLSTSLEIVQQELKMRPVQGRTSGLISGGETVRWEGWKFCLPQFHESVIESFEPPVFFRDRMIAGRFASFEHDHTFTRRANDTLLQDEIRFSMPLGWGGRVVGSRVLVPHIRGLMRRRFILLKQLAEGEGWRRYLPAS